MDHAQTRSWANEHFRYPSSVWAMLSIDVDRFYACHLHLRCLPRTILTHLPTHRLHPASTTSTFLAWPSSGHDIVNPQQQRRRLHKSASSVRRQIRAHLDRGLQRLDLHARRFQEPVLLHIRDFASISIDPEQVQPLRMFSLDRSASKR